MHISIPDRQVRLKNRPWPSPDGTDRTTSRPGPEIVWSSGNRINLPSEVFMVIFDLKVVPKYIDFVFIVIYG
jgi:hypothetical protein